MAKKKKTIVEVETPQIEETVTIEKPVIKTSKPEVKSKNTWEIKDRQYFLTNKKTPLSYSIRASGIYWFD